MPPEEFEIIQSAVNLYIGSLGDKDFDTFDCAAAVYDAIEKEGYELKRRVTE